MENRLKEAPTQKHKKVIFTILRTSLFVYPVVFALGCNSPMRPTSRDSGSFKMNAARADALRIIETALSDNNPDIRCKAIEVVASGRQVRLMPKVQRLLEDEYVPVRFAAAMAVGDLEYSLGKRSVSRLLKDKDLNVVIAASYAMGKLGSAEYFQVLHRALENSDQTVRANAALLLGKSGDRRVVELLYETLQSKDSDDKVVFQTAESIAMLGDERIYPKLWTMLISAYADVRLAGISSMRAWERRRPRMP